MKLWVLVPAALLSACGYVGPPMPPTLDIPLAISDFRAWESGENIEFAFTLPSKTTEGLDLTTVRSIELRVAGNPPTALPVVKPGQPVMGQLPAQAWIGKSIVLAVRATGPKGKPSDWSNPASLEVIQPLAPPSGLKAQSVATGVDLTWTGSGPKYRVFRAEGSGQPHPLADSDTANYRDETVEYGIRYRYLVQSIAGDRQWSELSGEAEVTPRDIFPPGVPEGLSAVPTPQSIELAWTRNTETDFRGYNIYRSVDNSPYERIASLIEAPAFGDSMVQAGKRYRYAVSAVDLSGNESGRTPPVEAAAQ